MGCRQWQQPILKLLSGLLAGRRRTYMNDVTMKFLKTFPIGEKIGNKELLDQIARIWKRALEMSKWEKVEDVCFNTAIKDNQRLVDHVNVVSICSYEMGKTIEKYQGEMFDYDRLLALCLLHDVSKVLEFEPDGNGGFRNSDIGNYIQHGVYGAILAREEGMNVEMQHLILTHTPLSKLRPQFKEAILFSHIDLCDADMVFYERGLPLFAH